jgi:potassium channel
MAFLFNLLYIPFSIGLSYTLPKEFIFLDILAIVMYYLDSTLRSQLAVDKNYEVQLDKRKVARNYIKKYFPLDVISCIPFDYILLLLDNSPAAPYFRLLRLFKVYRIGEISTIFQKNASFNVNVSRILIMFKFFIICAHWFNCILLYFARWEYGHGRRFDGKTLLDWL